MISNHALKHILQLKKQFRNSTSLSFNSISKKLFKKYMFSGTYCILVASVVYNVIPVKENEDQNWQKRLKNKFINEKYSKLLYF